MNILIVALDFKPEGGGTAEYTHQIARHLSLAGDNVMVLSKRMDKDKEFDSTCPYKVYRHNFVSLLTNNRVRGYIDSYPVIRRIAREHHVDIIISNTLQSRANMCQFVSRLLGIRYCILTYGLEINLKVGLLERIRRTAAMRGADKVFCVSSFTQSLVMKYGVTRNRTSVISGGISIEDFKISGDKSQSPITLKFGLEHKKVIFTMARLVERKGIDMVIRALPKILQRVPEVVYLIAGDGPYQGELKRLVQEYGVEVHVIFAGRVDKSELQDFYDACDLFIMPNRELKNGDVEGFGIVFAEANACGKPVIAGRSGGAVDAVRDNQTGLLVDPLDIDEIADAVIHLLKNPEIAKQMGENGRKRVEKELTWNKLVSKMQGELKRLV